MTSEPAINPAILDGIAAAAREELDWEGTLTPETPLVSAMELDSLRMLTLVVAIEDHFKVCLEEGDEAGLTTVGDLAGLIQKRLAEAAG